MFLSNNHEQSEFDIITGENIPLEAWQNILEGKQYNEFDESEKAVQTRPGTTYHKFQGLTLGISITI